MTAAPNLPAGKALTDIAGFDDVLGGGLTRERVYLIEGSPGTGKTTLALQFLLAGARNGETGLYITLGETAEELRAGSASHGWALDAIDVFELVPPESLLDAEQQQSLLYSSDLELGETTRLIFDQVERVQPTRVVLDSLSEIRLLAQGSLRFRRQILALKHYFARHGTTVLLLDDLTAEAQDRTLHSIAHGVVRLEELAPEYGAERRRLRITKYRGTKYRGGYHDFTIATGGVTVFPRLIAAEHHHGFARTLTDTGAAELDTLLGGGLERGSSTLLVGPSGSGKTLLALSVAVAAMKRGEKAAVYVFDEELGLLLDRAAGLGFDLAAYRDQSLLLLEPIDAAELSPGEFAHKVCAHVERDGVRTVLLDSLNGYQAAMPQEQFLILHMHELLTYLNRQGVVTLLTMAQHGFIGEMKTPVDLTYLSDTVILLRYFEAEGRVRRALSVVKKRAGAHEDTIREFRITPGGFEIGAPLEQFHGVMQGVPVYTGGQGNLFGNDPA
ncbi:ATPase domain-containing protein [Azospirillum himalayense]|uniref:non-specific serine/threonine protein kinase n=1 Tax=Azospirillum himalayense TaxID=654847 RepID=A0ABW0G4F3_9PROT